MSGGLMQLVDHGAQDIYLTSNSQITYFSTTSQFNPYAIPDDHVDKIKNVKNMNDFLQIFMYKYIREKDRNGDDYYLMMAKQGVLDVMIVLENKCNWNMETKNLKNKDAYALAIENEHNDVIEYLEKNDKCKSEGKKIFPLDVSKQISINDKCIICHDELCDNDIICQCENNHYVHKKCIAICVSTCGSYSNISCPYCKQEMLKKSAIILKN